jgi:hypothetical protein
MIGGMVARGSAPARRVLGRAGRAGALRIAALYPQTSNAYYRVELPLRELQRRGHHVLWPDRHPLEKLLDGRLDFDVAMIHHYFGDEVLDIVRRLRRDGVAVIWDKDDDISATPRFVGAYKLYGGRRGVRRAYASSISIACAASAMTTPSAHLAETYRRAGVEHVEIIENYVAPEHVAPARARHRGVVVGITAAHEHLTDFKRLKLDATLRAVMRDHDGVRVVSIGLDHDLPPERHVNHRQIPVLELIAAEREFDIGLAPLVESRFNRARSNVKLKEYAAAGAMWLASPVGPYADMGQEQGGILVEQGDWRRVLGDVVDNARRRAELAERARAWARSQSADRGAELWESLLLRAVAAARA